MVGFETGAKRIQDAKTYSLLCISTAITFCVISLTVLLTFKEKIAAIYSDDVNVIALASHFLAYAAFFQLSDAIQAPIQGALRGYKDVTITFVMALISYWVIGLPLGYGLANFTNFGPYGYWIGLISGLAAGAISLSIRLLLCPKKNATKYISFLRRRFFVAFFYIFTLCYLKIPVRIISTCTFGLNSSFSYVSFQCPSFHIFG